MPSTTPQDRKPKKTTKKASSTQQTPAQPIPTAEDPTSKYAPDAWLSGGIGGMEDLQVPSGQLCLVRRPGMEGLMKAGVLHNVDTLSSLVNEKHLKRVAKGGKAQEIDIASLMDDPKALDDVLMIVDKVICHCVVKPEIHRTPNDVTRRQPGVVYADMVDINDKMFIFNYVVGGSSDLETFRRGLVDAVGGLEAEPGVSDETE